MKVETEALKDKLKVLKRFQQFYIPVEARELTHPSKAQAQGIVEMWAEVLTSEEAPKVPV